MLSEASKYELAVAPSESAASRSLLYKYCKILQRAMRKQSGFLGGSKPFHLEGGHVFLAVCRGAEGGSQFDSLVRIGSDSNRHGGPPESRGSERRVRLPARGITLQVSRVGARSDEVPVEQREEVQHAVQLSRSMEARASAENQTMRCHEVSLGNSCARHLRL